MTEQATTVYIPHGGGPLPLMHDRGHANLVEFLRAYPASIRRPDAIVVISAHWESGPILITAAEAPSLLFDYHGFPPETYQYEYPAPGHPQLAERAQALLADAGIESGLDAERGLDHGVFVPLMLMYPEAGIPCIQVSLSSSLDAGTHLRIGKALAPLKTENLLFLGSGFSFHNMKALMSKRDNAVDPQNEAFEDWLAQTCTDPELSEPEREQRLQNWTSAPHARYCHPREEHLLPLQVCYGLGQSQAKQVFRQTVAGFTSSAYQWG